MDELNKILDVGLQIGKQAADQAIGDPTETKGEDKRAQENSARWSPAVVIGSGVAIVGVLLLFFVVLRRR